MSINSDEEKEYNAKKVNLNKNFDQMLQQIKNVQIELENFENKQIQLSDQEFDARKEENKNLLGRLTVINKTMTNQRDLLRDCYNSHENQKEKILSKTVEMGTQDVFTPINQPSEG